MTDKPTRKGRNGGTLTPFVKGQSGNPSGRPKELPGFRAACREVTWDLLREIKKRLGDMEPNELIDAFEAVADRGGFVTTDKADALDIAKARLIITSLGLDKMSDAQRAEILEGLEHLKRPDLQLDTPPDGWAMATAEDEGKPTGP